MPRTNNDKSHIVLQVRLDLKLYATLIRTYEDKGRRFNSHGQALKQIIEDYSKVRSKAYSVEPFNSISESCDFLRGVGLVPRSKEGRCESEFLQLVSSEHAMSDDFAEAKALFEQSFLKGKEVEREDTDNERL